MKYFKKLAEHPDFGKNKEKSWQKVIRLFWLKKEIPQHYFTSISGTLNEIRESYWRDQRRKNMNDRIKPYLEDNGNDSY